MITNELAQPSPQAGFITETQKPKTRSRVRRTWNTWKAKGVVPYMKIGRRCLYDWPCVSQALLRRQRGGQEP